MNFCACGCGVEVKHRFVRGHSSRTSAGGWNLYNAKLMLQNPKKYHEQHSTAGKLGGKASQKTLKESKLGVYNPETGVKGGKSTAEKHGGWSGFNKVFRKEQPEEYLKLLIRKGKAVQEVLKREGKAFYNSEVQSRLGKRGGQKGGKRTAEVNKRNGTGFFDSTHRIQVMGGKKGGPIGGPASIQSQREKFPYYFMDVAFHSNGERQHSIWQLLSWGVMPVEGVNCHVRVGSYEFDSRPFDWLFIEYHPWDMHGLSEKEYYARRRKILDDASYNDCELIVVKNLDEFKSLLGDGVVANIVGNAVK